EFENLYAIKQTDYLKSYIEHLNKLELDIDKKINKTSIENSKKNEIIELDSTNSRDTLDNKIIKKNITDHPKIIYVGTHKAKKENSSNILIDKKNTLTTNKKTAEDITDSSNQEQLNTVNIKTNAQLSKTKSASSSAIDIKKLNPLIKKTINIPEKKQGEYSQKSATIRNPSKFTSLPNTAITNSEIPFNKENELSYSYSIGNAEQSFKGVFIALSMIVLLLISGYFYTSYDDTSPATKIISNETTNKIPSITEHQNRKKSKNILAVSDAIIINKVEQFNANKIIEENGNTKKYITNTMKSTKSANNTTVDNNKELSKNNSTSTYSANISKNKNDITITLYTPITNEKISSLKAKTEDTSLTKNTVKPENEKKVNLISNSKQYKIQIQSNKNQNIDPSIISKEIIHIVVKGDTLWHIAKFYVKDPYRYPELARLSNIKNPDLIYPGNRVHIIQIFTNENIQNE
ncbi:MAG: LysM peptidoglycan-binding domain-containing protein, partial [Thiohalomonadales bacterium]